MPAPPPVPLFAGLAVLGSAADMTASHFAGSAADEDAFLGLAPGTTAVGPCAGGSVGAVAATGVLTGPDVPTVQAAQAALEALAGVTAPLVVPSGGGRSVFDLWETWTAAWFAAGDLAWTSGVVASSLPGAAYQVSFAVIFRRAGGPELGGFVTGPPLPPNWPSPGGFQGRPV